MDDLVSQLNAATEQSVMNAAFNSEVMRQLPSVLYRPRLFVDGNQWCALYGDNLHDGVAGFGNSPAEAMHAFDEAWNEKLPTTS